MARKKTTKLLSAIAAFAVAGLTLSACAGPAADGGSTDTGNNDGGSSETQVVKLGVVGASDPYWAVYEEAVENELDIDLQIVDFGEYNLPNPALKEGDLDINQFQHIIYLAEHINATGDDLVPIGTTAIYPLSLHSLKYESIDQIQEGETIAIPNDPSNKARALLVLQQAGLLELKDGGNTGSTADDILSTSKVKVTELDAAFTVTSLNDVAGAVVNNDFVEKAGLDFDKALFKDNPEDPSALPYVNIFVVRGADKDNELYNKLVEIYQNNQEVLDGVQAVSGGTAVFAKTPAAELQEALAKQLEVVKAAG